MTSAVDLSRLEVPGGWRTGFTESGPGLVTIAVRVAYAAPDAWRITYDSGEEIIAGGGLVTVSDGERQTALRSTLVLPAGLELLGTPHTTWLERLLAQAVDVLAERKGGRAVWRLALRDGSVFALDAELLMGHLFLSTPGGLRAQFTDLDPGTPPEGTFVPPDLPAADRAGLARLHLSGSPASEIAPSTPQWELYLHGQLWVAESGPSALGFDEALRWCEERAVATEITLDGPRGRDRFGVGRWAGAALPPIPAWLIERR